MNTFVELKSRDLEIIDGGCVWCKIGGTLVTVGGVIATGVNPVSVGIGLVSLYTIWG